MEQEQLTLPEHLSSLPVFSGVRVTRSCFMCMFCRSLFVPFLLVIVVSVFLRFTDPLVSSNSSYMYIFGSWHILTFMNMVIQYKYNTPKVWFTLTSFAIASPFLPFGYELLNCGLPSDVTAWLLRLLSLNWNALRYNLQKWKQ